jgi:hypothetical protein
LTDERSEEELVELLAGIFAVRTEQTTVPARAERVLEQVITALSEHLAVTGEDALSRFLDVADEVAASRLLVGPLLTALGFEAVRVDEHKDRRLEFGQDVREMRLRLPTGHCLYFVAQVKRELRSTTAMPDKDVEAVILQIEKALEKTMFDYEVGADVRPDHAFLIVLGSVSKDARLFLEERISADKRRRVLVIQRSEILELCRSYGLPLDAQSEIRRYLTKAGGS